MRWKLLIPTSIIAAFLALTLWSALALTVFGSAREMARNDWTLLGSLLIPLGVATFSAIFAYRHTARRRKTQAVLTFAFALFFSAAFYLTASQVFPETLVVPRTWEVRRAR